MRVKTSELKPGDVLDCPGFAGLSVLSSPVKRGNGEYMFYTLSGSTLQPHYYTDEVTWPLRRREGRQAASIELQEVRLAIPSQEQRRSLLILALD